MFCVHTHLAKSMADIVSLKKKHIIETRSNKVLDSSQKAFKIIDFCCNEKENKLVNTYVYIHA